MLMIPLLLLACFGRITALGVYNASYNMMLSETLPGNLLPQFKFQLGSIEGKD
jgi:hypothetical protein